MNKPDIAASFFQDGFNCAQSVFVAFAPDLGLDQETALKVSTAFGGGMGRLGEACGAVTGALMALGLKYGRATKQDVAARDKTYALTQEFARRFRQRHDALTCRDLLGCDPGTPEGQAMIKERGLHTNLCTGLVRDAAEILEEMLSEETLSQGV